MDSLEVNKVCAAVLVAGIGYMAATLIADGLVQPRELEKTAIAIEGVQTPATSTAATEAAPPPIAAFLAKADPAAGQAGTQKLCVACHNFNEGGAAKIGPDLYGVVGRPVASFAGFDYSSALKSHHGPWTFDELNAWLLKPQTYAPGTKMGFGGINSEKERADVIDYLRTLSHTPEALPPVTPTAVAAAPAAGAPATTAAPAAPSIAAYLAKADPSVGQADTQKYCVVCHNFNKGGAVKIGPDLYGVVGRPVASFPGFNYSAALKAHHGPWTFDELNAWLRKPAAYAPGTMMGFAGFNSEKDRADVIDYLRTLSDHPEPLPAASAAPVTGAQSGNSNAGSGGAGAAAGATTAMPRRAGAMTPGTVPGK